MTGARVLVVGPPAAGKTHLAHHLADAWRLRHLELDAVVHGPGWTPATTEAFDAEVAGSTADGRWVADGNYFDRTAALWESADTVVWLDLPLRVILPRLIRRSLRRILTRQELWHGNHEQWSALIGRDSLVLWAITSRRTHRRTLPGRLAALHAARGVDVVRLRSRRAVRAWTAGPGSARATPATEQAS